MAAATTTTPQKEVAPTTEKKAERIEKPEKPDEEAHKKLVAKLEAEHKAVMEKFNAVRTKLDSTKSNKDGPLTPQQERRKELQARQNEIRKEQGANKAGRNSTMDQIKKLDEQLKSRINEQKVARGKVNYKSVEDVDREIATLEKQVDGGQMKLVDEKKALAEISSLRKLRKSFGGFEEGQKKIDEIKAQIKELKDSMNDPVAKARSEEYNKIQAELDVIKAEQDEAYKNISTLRDEKTKLQKEQQAKYQEIRAAKDAHWAQKRAFQNYEYEARAKLRERKKAEQDAYNNQKKRERAEKVLAEASEPAYLDEIRRASSLLHYFEPSSATDSKPLLAPSGLAASSGRTVDDAGIKGFKLVKKDEEDYFAGTGGKKGKKGKKGTSSPAVASGKFSVPPSVLEDCSAMSIDPPMSQAEVPAVVEKVKAKLDHWKKDQKAQTEKNIAKAQKEIERLDAEESGSSTPKETATNAIESAKETATNAAETAKQTVASAVETVKETVTNAVTEVTHKVAELTTSEENKENIQN